MSGTPAPAPGERALSRVLLLEDHPLQHVMLRDGLASRLGERASVCACHRLDEALAASRRRDLRRAVHRLGAPGRQRRAGHQQVPRALPRRAHRRLHRPRRERRRRGAGSARGLRQGRSSRRRRARRVRRAAAASADRAARTHAAADRAALRPRRLERSVAGRPRRSARRFADTRETWLSSPQS